MLNHTTPDSLRELDRLPIIVKLWPFSRDYSGSWFFQLSWHWSLGDTGRKPDHTHIPCHTLVYAPLSSLNSCASLYYVFNS